METSSRNSDMAMLAVTQHTLELSEARMEKSRQLCRQAEDACKAANDLLATLDNYGFFNEVKLMRGVSKKLDQLLKKRSDALSVDTDWYLGMEAHLRNLTSGVILEISQNTYNLAK